jgi:hypothetical protein
MWVAGGIEDMMCFEDSWGSLVWRSVSDNNEEGSVEGEDDDERRESVGVASDLIGFEGGCCCEEGKGQEARGCGCL